MAPDGLGYNVSKETVKVGLPSAQTTVPLEYCVFLKDFAIVVTQSIVKIKAILKLI